MPYRHGGELHTVDKEFILPAARELASLCEEKKFARNWNMHLLEVTA
jgi:hypothetical protein